MQRTALLWESPLCRGGLYYDAGEGGTYVQYDFSRKGTWRPSFAAVTGGFFHFLGDVDVNCHPNLDNATAGHYY